MNSKTFLITFTNYCGHHQHRHWYALGLYAHRARTNPLAESQQETAPTPSDDSYLPSREYVEGRARAFKQLREETLKAQFSRMNSNKSGVPYSY